MYGLGLTLYELLTLEPAFDASDRLRVIEQVKSQEPTRPRLHDPRIPRDLETIILKAIDKDCKRRYSTADEMAEDLRRYLDDEPILARRTTSTERLARWARRNPGVAALGGVLAAVLVLATTISIIVAGRMALLADRAEKSAGSERISRIAEYEARKHEAALRAEAEAAQRRTADALAETETQRARAEAGFAKGRAAVDNYLTTVSESQLLQVAGLQPLRRDLLQSALTFYEGFVKERGDDPALRSGLASALLRIGKIQKDLGQDDEARVSLDQATALHEALLKERPGDVELKNGLAECHSYLREAGLAALKALVGERPEDAATRRRDQVERALGLDYARLGLWDEAAHKPGEHDSFLVVRALLDCRAGAPGEAAELLEKSSLASDDPWSHLGRITLALSRFRLGRESQAFQDLHRASEMLRRSRPRFDRGQQYSAIFWQDWLAPEVLLREAEEILLDLKFPADPFARAGRDARR